MSSIANASNFKPRINPVLEDSDAIYIFNTSDFTTDNDKISTALVNAKLDNYVSEYGESQLVGDLKIASTASLIFQGDLSEQIRAYSEEKNSFLASVVDKTQFLTIDHGLTKVEGISVNGPLLMAYNLPANKIGSGNVSDGRLGTLSDINITTTVQSQLNSKQATINSSNRLNTNLVADGSISNEQLECLSDLVTDSTIESRLQSQASDISTNSTQIQTNTSDLSTHTGQISDLVSVDEGLQSQIDTNTADLSTHTGQIADLATADEDLQSQIDTKASSSSVSDITDRLVDLTYTDTTTSIANTLSTDTLTANSLQVNNSVEIDGTFIISNSNYTVTDEQFGYLKDLDSDVKTNLSALQSQIDSNDNDITTLQSTVSNHSTTLGSHTTSLTSNATAITNLQTASTSQASTISSHTSTLSSHTSSLASNATAITNLQSADTTINGLITDLTNNKQDVLSSSNRLNSSNIGDGSISNNAFQTLYGIDTSQSIQHQIDQINTTVSSISGLEDLDISAISDLQTSVSGKQDTLSSGNKLNPAYINAG